MIYKYIHTLYIFVGYVCHIINVVDKCARQMVTLFSRIQRGTTHVCFITYKGLINCYKCLHLLDLAEVEGGESFFWWSRKGSKVRAGINMKLTSCCSH